MRYLLFTSDVEKMIVKRVPKWIVERVRDNMNHWSLDLYDAFQEAVRAYSKPSKELSAAFYADDFRAYIPSAYREEYLDFGKYPLRYQV